MFDHGGPRQLPVDEVHFWHRGRRYAGTGVLDWDPSSGCELMCRLTEALDNQHPMIDVVRAGPRLVPRSAVIMRSGARMASPFYALAYVFPMMSPFDRLSGDHFWKTLRFEECRFVQAAPDGYSQTETSLRVPTGIRLPHRLSTALTVGSEKRSTGWRMKGIRHDEDDIELIGHVEGDVLKCSWRLKQDASIPEYRRWSQALADALSAMMTDNCQLQSTRIVTAGRQERFVAAQRKSMSVMSVSLFADQDAGVDLDIFIPVLRLLAQDSPRARVARNLIRRVIQAWQSGLTYATDLAIGTALEAALRTLRNDATDDFSVNSALPGWRKYERLSKEWNRLHDDIYEAFRQIRHRNAHRHWLAPAWTLTGHSESDESLLSRNRLVRYYGHMIRVLAGIPPEPDLRL